MRPLNLKKIETGNVTNKSPFDWVIFLSMVILIAFGIMTIYSTSFATSQLTEGLFQRQVIYAGLGLGMFIFVSRLDYKIFAQTAVILYLLTLALLLATFIWGISTRGSTRWIDLGWIRAQPSEVIKPVLIAVLALYYSTREKLLLRHFLMGLFLASLPAVLVFRQPDLGSALVIMGIWFVMSLVAGFPYRYLLGLTTLGVVGLPFFFNLLKDYQKSRLTTFLNPQVDPLGSGYNIIQAIIAVGSGQLLGQGFGRGTQSHLNFLPEQHTDFIFATLAEELGFVGVLLVMGVFLVLLIRMLVVAKNSSDKFGMLLVSGVVSMILLQLFINVGMNVGLLPVTGITLPFISFGGSSLIAMIVSVGLVEAVARARKHSVLEIG